MSPSRAWPTIAFASSPEPGAVDSDRGFLELNAAGDVEIHDVTDELAVIGIWGPLVRDVLGAAIPYRSAGSLSIGGVDVFAQRITYVGEFGYELYVERDTRRAGLGRAVRAAGRSRSATTCSTRCGSRRATATSAPI